jgi:gluconate 2-dehydrogenase alpha chain
MAIEKTDVVIVGVGAAGGILAAELGKAGMKVIGLERGPRLTTEDFMPHDELRFFQRQDLRPDVKRQPVTWRPNANARAEPLPTLGYGNQAGGGTVHYGAVSWRLHEDDFSARSHTIERYGASAIPVDSSLADWPLSYADLEPYYDRAEYELGVSGKAGNLQGNKIAGGNVFEAPRRRDYPLPPLRDDQSGVIFHGAAEKLGYHPFPTPHAILSQDYNGRPSCTYCGFCQAFGCHVGAKSSILVTKLPEADATGHFKLITGAMCYCVNSDNSGRVSGVSYYGPGGSDNTIEAELVILSPFIYDNTRLLLLSKTDKFPNGLANSSGQVGKHLTAHMMPNVLVAFDDRYVNVFMGPSAMKHTIEISMPTISTMPASDSYAARRSRLARSACRADRLAPPLSTRHPVFRAGVRPIATTSRPITRSRRPWSRRPKICPTPTRPSTSTPMSAINGACRRRA